MTRQCCVCGKIHENGDWRQKTALPHEAITHTYCPACLQAHLAMAEMDFGRLQVRMVGSQA